MKYKITVKNILKIIWPILAYIALAFILSIIINQELFWFLLIPVSIQLLIIVNYFVIGLGYSLEYYPSKVIIRKYGNVYEFPNDSNLQLILHESYSQKGNQKSMIFLGFYYLVISVDGKKFKFNSLHFGETEVFNLQIKSCSQKRYHLLPFYL